MIGLVANVTGLSSTDRSEVGAGRDGLGLGREGYRGGGGGCGLKE